MSQGLTNNVEDFPASTRKFLDDLYAGQKSGAVTEDLDKIELLERLISEREGNVQVTGYFEKIEGVRKAYEYYLLYTLNLLNNVESVPLGPITKKESKGLISLSKSVWKAPKTKGVYLGGEDINRSRRKY